MRLHHYASIAEQFTPSGRVINVREFDNGNINDTYLLTTDVARCQGKQGTRVVAPAI